MSALERHRTQVADRRAGLSREGCAVHPYRTSHVAVFFWKDAVDRVRRCGDTRMKTASCAVRADVKPPVWARTTQQVFWFSLNVVPGGLSPHAGHRGVEVCLHRTVLYLQFNTNTTDTPQHFGPTPIYCRLTQGRRGHRNHQRGYFTLHRILIRIENLQPWPSHLARLAGQTRENNLRARAVLLFCRRSRSGFFSERQAAVRLCGIKHDGCTFSNLRT